jgi:hypothetical protein
MAATTLASDHSSAYTALRAEEQDGQVLIFRYADASRKSLTFADAMRHLAASNGPGAALRSQVIAAIRDAPFPAVFWECAPASGATAAQAPFEFVVVSSSALARVTAGEPDAFAEHLATPCASAEAPPQVATFSNLGRDAVLVAPCPLAPATSSAPPSSSAPAYGEYAHLAPFVRRAPAAQVHAFFQAVGAAALARLELNAADATSRATTSSAKPVWLSTSGLGVFWLHVRLDDRPKYYTYAPFKRLFD